MPRGNTARRIVAEVISALIHGDLSGHMAFVAEDVVTQLNNNPPQQGKSAYQQMLEMLRDSGEGVTAFTVGEVVNIAHDKVVVRVHEDHRLAAALPPRWQDIGLKPSFRSFYTVSNGSITEVRLDAFGAPNRVARYP